MEYEFIHDSLTGLATAKFSMEHEIMGPWLEVEIGNSVSKLTKLLETIADSKIRQQEDVLITGAEYSLIFSEDSVHIAANSEFMNDDQDDEFIIEQGLSLNSDSSAECGIEDFKEILMKWSHFIK